MSLLMLSLSLLSVDPAVDESMQRKLAEAKAACDAEIKVHHQKMAAWMSKNESAARKRGDLKKVEQIQGDLKELKMEGRIPPALPPVMRRNYSMSLRELGYVYKDAMQKSLKNKNDAKAKELGLLLASLRASDIDFNGAWRVTHSNGWSGVRTVYGSKVTDSNGDQNARWRLDKTTFICEWYRGGAEWLAVDPDNPDRLFGVRPDGVAITWERIKPSKR